ncbi:MAG TPA: hypothetical protein PKE52_06245, partial [Bacteroidales bacterium]|nr:hypothetical protein [Bacteroidales bacterium]
MDYQEFYIETGRLLYAIAMDGAIQEDEKSKMLNLVRDTLRKLEGSVDAFGTSNAFYTEFELERLIDFNVDSRESFDSFIDYFESNRSEMTSDLKSIIIQMAEEVAEAWDGVV